MRTQGLIFKLALISINVLISIKGYTKDTADSLVIQFANRTKLVIYAPDKAGIKALSSYDLNKIVRDMGMKLDSLPNGKEAKIVIDGETGARYLKDTVIVITREKGKISVSIPSKTENRKTDSTLNDKPEKGDIVINVDKNGKVDKRLKKVSSLNTFTHFQLGLNTILTNQEQAAFPSNRYDLRPLGSRYFAIGLGQRPTIVKGKKVRLNLQYGLEIAWNNLMFENDITVQKGPSQILFTDIQESIKRSKLTICTIQLPVIPRVSFYNESGKKVFHLGLGGYVGYRVDSYTKIKYANGSKNRDHDSYYLNDLRYGLIAHLGIIKTNLFVKYDLNPIFQDAKGPDTRLLSFGITL